jgi:CBS domain-containing protein
MPVARNHMSRDLLTVAPGDPIGEVAKRMCDRDVGAVLVMEGESLAGILTERDVLRAVAAGIQDDTVVSDHMTRDPETMSPDDTTQHAAVLMIHGGFRHMPLVEGDEVVGMLSIRDLMRVVLDNAAPRGASGSQSRQSSSTSDPRRRSRMPPLRRRRKFASGRVSGSRASPALSTCTACSSGAPMCGVPSDTL